MRRICFLSDIGMYLLYEQLLIMYIYSYVWGHAVAQLVEALC